jgi:hypothetical protein
MDNKQLAPVYTPPEASKQALEALEKIEQHKTRGIKMPLEEIGDYFAPTIPGQLTAIIAQTSNYKSGFMHWWERRLAEQLVEEERYDESIIHVSVEECLEEQIFYEFARESGESMERLAHGDVQDWNKLRRAAAKIATIPIYRLGDSLARPEMLTELYLTNIVRSIDQLVKGEITDEPIRPAAIFVDYLQALPLDPENKKAQGDYSTKRRLQVRSDVYRLRNAAVYFNCPVVIGVQAKQVLAGNPSEKILIPGRYDGEESSAIAQRADRIISLWLPKMDHPVGSQIEISGKRITVEENQMFLKICKQRGGFRSGKFWLTMVDYDKNEISTAKV